MMVSTDPNDTPETIEGFRERGDVGPLPWAVDERGEVARALGVNALETTIVVDREGEVVYKDATSTDYETLMSELEKIL